MIKGMFLDLNHEDNNTTCGAQCRNKDKEKFTRLLVAVCMMFPIFNANHLCGAVTKSHLPGLLHPITTKEYL
jgi:hypothetical protein